MKRLYLILTILGFVAPNIFVLDATLATGNILLWTNPAATIQGMFANTIATAFVVDLLFVVVVFLVWSASEAKRLGMSRPWPVWLATMLLGLAGGFPLFLYLREDALEIGARP